MNVRAFGVLWVTECSGDSRLPARSHALYTSPNGCNMGAPREGADADAGAENSFAVAHFQRLNAFVHHRCAIYRNSTSMAGKLGRKVYSYFQEPEGKFGTIVQKKKKLIRQSMIST
jgi:hypothetical protein